MVIHCECYMKGKESESFLYIDPDQPNESPYLLRTGFIFMCTLIAGIHSLQARQVELTSSDLPIIIIDTRGEAIPYDDPRAIADMDVIYNGPGFRNQVSDPADHYSGLISIEIRGESSAGWDYKSYGIETQNEDGSNRNVSLLGLPEEQDWVLHAPYYDRSLLRNVLIFDLARKMGWYASRTVYCELILNGEYQGIYVLMEKIKRDDERVNIATLSPEETTGDDVTGGYILRVDKEEWSPGVNSSYPPRANSNVTLRYQYYYPKPDVIVQEQEQYISSFIQEFEDLMHDGDFSTPEKYYSNYLNVDSFVDYVLLNELSRNVDGYRLSTYLTKQKDSDGGKLIAGPVWDYNFSFGNADYYDGSSTEGWQLDYFAEDPGFQWDQYQSPFWWKVLFDDGKFRKKLNDRWDFLRQNVLSTDSLNASIDRFTEITREARSRNFQIRPEPGSISLGGGWYPSDARSSQIDSYEDEIHLTKLWIENRSVWMDENLPLLTTSESTDMNESPGTFELYQNHPNPFNPSTQIRYQLSVSSQVSLKVYDFLGHEVAVLVNAIQNAGQYQVTFNASELSSGVYIYQLDTGGVLYTKKMLLVK